MPRLLTIVFLLMALWAQAQQSFIKSYGFAGYNEGVDITHYQNGFLVIGNSSLPGGNTQVYVARLDSAGNKLWDQAYFQNEIVHVKQAMLIGPDSILLAGTIHNGSVTAYDYFAALVDTSGQVYWDRTFGGTGWQEFNCFAIMKNRIWLAGSSKNDTSAISLSTLTRMRLTGYVEISHLMNAKVNAGIHAMDVVGDSLLLTAGYRMDSSAQRSYAHLMMLEENLQPTLDTVVADTLDAELLAVRWVKQAIVAGGFYNDSTDAMQVLAVGLNPNTLQKGWFRAGGAKDEALLDMTVTAHGFVYATGYTESYGSGGRDVYVSIQDSIGFWKYSTTFGGHDDETGYSIITDDSSRMIICGSSESWGPNYSDIFVMITDSADKNVSYVDHSVDVHEQKTIAARVYPNPFRESFTITLPAKASCRNVQFSLYDMSGRRVKSVELQQSKTIPCPELKPGIYLLREESTGKIWKLVKID